MIRPSREVETTHGNQLEIPHHPEPLLPFSKPCHIAIDFDKIGYKITDLAVKKEPYESPCKKSANADKSA